MYEIKPYIGVGEIQFGMKSEKICGILGDKYKRYENQYTPGFRLCYPEIHIFFDENNCCNAIEGFISSGFYFNNVEIVGKSFITIKKIFEVYDDELEINEDGFISYKLGISVYVPTLKKSKKELIQGVIAFKEGYYDL